MRRYCLIALFGLFVAAPSALFAAGADEPAAAAKVTPLVLPTGAALVAADSSNGTEIAPPILYRQSPSRFDARRPLLFALYGGAAVIQAYDGVTTMRVLRAGGYEANPVMQAITKNQKTLIAAKLGATAATIIGTESLWRGNHKWAARVVGFAANSAMAAVVSHNAKVLDRFEAARVQ